MAPQNIPSLKNGTTTDSRAVITGKQAGVVSQGANVPTSVEDAGVTNLSVPAACVQNHNPILNVQALVESLRNHPDKDFVNTIVSYAQFGVPIGYSGSRHFRISKNWPSALKHKEAVQASIEKDCARGRKAGPFLQPPMQNFVGSPMGAFIKKRSPGKIRVIHDLSWPPGESVNDHIFEDCSVHYITMDKIASLVKHCGSGCFMAKLDLEDAYKHIMVRCEDRELLGSVWDFKDENGHITNVYYVDLVLPFGLKSSAKLFNMFADALEFICKDKGATIVTHYLDDYFTCGSQSVCLNNLEIMKSACKNIGFGVQPTKVIGPTQELEYLGITVDSTKMEFKMSQERIYEIISLLRQWIKRKTCSKRQLLSLLGKLIFVSRVVRAGRTFVGRIIELSKSMKHIHHHTRLSVECRKDLAWWLKFLPIWNGVSIFYEEHWENNIDLHLWTDASNIGFGAYFQGAWVAQKYSGRFTAFLENHINWREMYALVSAAATWGHKLAGKRVLFHCDNLVTVSCIQSGKSKDSNMMRLIRSLFLICGVNNFECNSIYVAGMENDITDSLSRLDLCRFRALAPEADRYPTVPV